MNRPMIVPPKRARARARSTTWPALGWAALSSIMAASAEAAPEAPPSAPVTLTLNETLDLWRNVKGGIKVGDTQLNKLQIIADLDGEAWSAPRWKARLQYFRTNGESLSGGRIGDIQTASNIEALSADRLMEAWVERRIGRTGALRAGLMDLNADFDSIEPAALFLNSSHGIAPDLSRTGRNGPSIFPVSALGVHGQWSPRRAWTVRVAVFDGVPGDPDHPKAFAAVKLRRGDGALLIAQTDWAAGEAMRVSFGAWRYSGRFDLIDDPTRRQRGWAGVYAFAQGRLPAAPNARAWFRVGRSDPDVAEVAGYVGAGTVFDRPFPNRPDDALGFAVARAGLGEPIRIRDGLPRAETAFELTYRFQASPHVALQPDVQYVRNPASRTGTPDARAFALRISFTAEH